MNIVAITYKRGIKLTAAIHLLFSEYAKEGYVHNSYIEKIGIYFKRHTYQWGYMCKIWLRYTNSNQTDYFINMMIYIWKTVIVLLTEDIGYSYLLCCKSHKKHLYTVKMVQEVPKLIPCNLLTNESSQPILTLKISPCFVKSPSATHCLPFTARRNLSHAYPEKFRTTFLKADTG